MSDDLLAAFALLLVIEGLFPFAMPHAMRRMWQQVSSMPDATLRTIGFISMLAGLILLYFIRKS